MIIFRSCKYAFVIENWIGESASAFILCWIFSFNISQGTYLLWGRRCFFFIHSFWNRDWFISGLVNHDLGLILRIKHVQIWLSQIESLIGIPHSVLGIRFWLILRFFNLLFQGRQRRINFVLILLHLSLNIFVLWENYLLGLSSFVWLCCI